MEESNIVENTKQDSQTPPGNTTAVPEFDYDRVAQIVAGKQTATEESVLKGYFKQQGLSKEQMQQAITTFKQQQAESQPDINALQQEAKQAAELARSAMIEKDAMFVALEMGVDSKTIPYILKLADLNQATGQDGKTNIEAVQSALKKVMEDIPALKPTAEQQSGFRQVGAAGGGKQQTANQDALKAAFGL